MDFVNHTVFPAASFRQFDRDGGLDAVIAVRGTFDLAPGGTVGVAEKGEAFQWEDCYDGDPHAVPLMRQADLVPFKPGTDVTVLADAHCPEPAGAPAWLCALRIVAGDTVRLEKQLRVTGPRHWTPQLRPNWRTLVGGTAPPRLLRWVLSSPEAARTVPLDWCLARGGVLPDGKPGTVHQDNPLGRGIVGQHDVTSGQPVPAPQIELPGAQVNDWRADPPPAGMGPISPWWGPRHRYAGTYDQAWLDTRHPLLPFDFDERFWQCAPPDQVITPWLRGTERFDLLNLHPDHPRLSGTLPGIMLGLAVYRDDLLQQRAPLNLDGVHFDLRPDWDRLILTWRVRVPMADPQGVRLELMERARIAVGVPA